MATLLKRVSRPGIVPFVYTLAFLMIPLAIVVMAATASSIL